jgi:hypothetical protein
MPHTAATCLIKINLEGPNVTIALLVSPAAAEGLAAWKHAINITAVKSPGEANLQYHWLLKSYNWCSWC